MFQKKDIIPRTMESPIVQDGLGALSTLVDEPLAKCLYFIVGGIAVQSYLPKQCYRPTADIDVCLARPLNNRTVFKELVRLPVEFLCDRGYNLGFQKASQNFKMVVVEPETDDYLLVEFARRNSSKYNQVAKRIERELAHVKKKVIGHYSLDVASSEDIAVPKIVRSTNSLIRNEELKSTVKFLGQQMEKGSLLRDLLNYSIEERAKANVDDIPLLKDKARLVADFYDVLCLSKYAGFNESYLEKAAGEWDRTKNTEEWKWLVETLYLPLSNKLKEREKMIGDSGFDPEPITEVIPLSTLPLLDREYK